MAFVFFIFFTSIRMSYDLISASTENVASDIPDRSQNSSICYIIDPLSSYTFVYRLSNCTEDHVLQLSPDDPVVATLFFYQRKTTKEPCISGKFDAITRTSDGNTYSFRAQFVLQFNEDGTGVAPGFPKTISDVFPGLPSNLDAAVNWMNGKTYFFKGNQYWATNGTTLLPGYPKYISVGWPGLPDDIDAGLVWGKSGKGYFFKGNRYWRYDPQTNETDFNKSTKKNWPGYDQNTVNAAFQWSDGRSYFFKDEHYWLYNDTEDRFESGYPLFTTQEWMGCETNGRTVSIDIAFSSIGLYVTPAEQ